MGKFVSEDTNRRIFDLMFRDFGDSPEEEFLKKEIVRYIPQMTGWSDDEIGEFVRRQRYTYLSGFMPDFGAPIASLNPTFIDSLDAIKFKVDGGSVYTRASEKENGFRMQLHISPNGVSAFTRQFTAYDLRMFPELEETLRKLPVMIGDVELVNKRHKHLAGFHRVEKRIPGVKYWPKRGAARIDDELLRDYFLNQRMFDSDGQPLEEFELELVFHGLFAISDPEYWRIRREIQATRMFNFCFLPVNYPALDSMLDKLDEFCRERDLNARVVKRQVVGNKQALRRYVKKKDEEGLEGVCVVQSAFVDAKPSFAVGKSFKIKKYETIDAVLMGLYLERKADGLKAGNIKGGLLGLFDGNLGMFLPALKVNFDPSGPQIKTAGQRERLTELREELVSLVPERVAEEALIPTLYDVFLRQGEIMLWHLLKEKLEPEILGQMLESVPRGQDMKKLVTAFCQEKATPSTKKFLEKYRRFFRALFDLDFDGTKRCLEYFSRAAAIKATSAKLAKPQAVLDLSQPIVMEAKIFGIKWGLCPFPAGFHTWYGNSFHFNNAFAERIRYDKDTTTDYATIYELARRNTVKEKKRVRK